MKGISNPIGIKVGPKFEPDELTKLIAVLNPDNEPGRITLIHRFGADNVAIQTANQKVLFCSDPMHGNTFSTNSGIKTRSFEKIANELEVAFQIHQKHGSILGGVHLELTGDNVTECIGGSGKLTEPDLERAYKSQVDPRLNYDQAMELAFLVADNMKSNKDHLQE